MPAGNGGMGARGSRCASSRSVGAATAPLRSMYSMAMPNALEKISSLSVSTACNQH